MATPQELVARGLLVPIEVELDPDEQPQRLIYAYPRAKTWMENVLPCLQTDGYFEGAASPSEQADALLYEIVSGKSSWEMPPKCLYPTSDGAWELRTHDLRFFGWFWRKGVFIMTSVETKQMCLKGYYTGHKNQSLHDRNMLDLDPPKFVAGSELDDVL